MDAYGFLVVLLLVSCGASAVSGQENQILIAKAAAAIATNDIDDTTSPPVTCTTAKGLNGVCVERQYCEYSTQAIDLTLYANRGYVRFLKDWPKWDEFDQDINLLRKKNAQKSIKKILETKYLDLKSFLQVQLVEAKPLAEKAVTKMLNDNSKRMEKVDTSELTLEIYCTRKQLNELIFTQPTPGELENTVFNLTAFKPTSITVNKLPIESILNWCGIQIVIDTKHLFYQRKTNHQLKHVLVNSHNGPRNFSEVLKTDLQIKDAKRTTEDIEKAEVFKFFDKLLKAEAVEKNGQKIILQSLLEIVKNDLHSIDTVRVPATYRQYSAKYPYFRKLKKDVVHNTSSRFNLYIEETIVPMHLFVIGKMPEQLVKSQPELWFMIECMECKLKFKGDEMYARMREHFDMYHTNEPDWTCTNCEKMFTMTELARNKWQHNCS